VTHSRALVTAAALLVAAPLVIAQAPQGAQPQTPPSRPADQAVTVQPTTTLSGCLYREAQVPGRTPNVAERAGILEDYILADATAASTASATSGATGTSGAARPVTGTMYKVERIADDQLKALVGKRVEVTGKIDPEGTRKAGRRATRSQPEPGHGEPARDRSRLDSRNLGRVPGDAGTPSVVILSRQAIVDGAFRQRRSPP
jgi:hypothetical protein